MALPFVLLAAKAGALAKTAGPALAEWNRLPPDAKARVRSEAADVTRTLNELRRALGARLFGPDDEEITWDQARELALEPPTEFVMARRIVELVRSAAESDEADLRAEFAGGHHAGFEQALAIAAEDGYVESVGSGRWRITAFADMDLVESDEVRFVEAAIVDHVTDAGLAGRDELALAVGAPEYHSPAFLAGMERALASGAVEWLGPGLYGLPRDVLRQKVQAPHPEPAEEVDRTRVKTIVRDLAREIAELRTAVARERRGGGRPSLPQPQALAPDLSPQAPPPPAAAPPANDPMVVLRQLKELFDAGLITADEYERKKADILDKL